MRTGAKALPINASTPIGDLMICTIGVLASKVGPVRVGLVVHKDDARAIGVPEAFRPLIERVDLDRTTRRRT